MSTSEIDLEKLGYSYLASHRIWRREHGDEFKYSDGDFAENNIFNILKNAVDVSVTSEELRASCVDWPSQYHLSASRSNLLRPLTQKIRGDVLEIGAGCGAITRFLGECGANIFAVEGSARRAAIAAERTRDLPNVKVVNDNFNDFKPDSRFDVITLIGVLEYAAVFGAGDDPVQEMLGAVKSLLKPGGILIVAIENQLGLKYLAGVPEDHLNIPRVGVQGLYQKGGVQTFGRAELVRRFERAGFDKLELALPFPDYKFPISVIFPSGYEADNGLDSASLAAQTSSRDAQVSAINLTMSLECLWGVVGKNNLIADLANSFLFVVHNHHEDATDTFASDVLGYHYSTNRKNPFCKVAEFTRNNAGLVSVTHKLLYPSVGSSFNDTYAHKLPNEAFCSGYTMNEVIIREVQNPGWTAKKISSHFQRYLLEVVREAGTEKAEQPVDLNTMVSGKLLDLVPQNIICSSDGRVVVIDQEWSTVNDISLSYLVFRALTTLIRMVSSFAVPLDVRWLNQERLFQDVYSHLGGDFTRDLYEEYAQEEASFMTFATGRHTPVVLYSDWSSYKLPSFLDQSKSLTAPLVDHLSKVQDIADTYLSQIKWLEGENDSRRLQIEALEAEVEAVDGELRQAREGLHMIGVELDSKAKLLESKEIEVEEIKKSRAWKLATRLTRFASVFKG